MKKALVYLSLGGNEGAVAERFQKVLECLSSHPVIYHLKISPFYRTAPFEADTEEWFLNAVCSFETFLSPSEVFHFTQSIERELGKVPKDKRASRVIDIDLLFYDSRIYQDGELQIPHPRWKERLFVLVPLADLVDSITVQESLGECCYVLKEMIRIVQERGLALSRVCLQVRRQSKNVP